MTRFVKGTAAKTGMAPGTLVHVGDPSGAPVRIAVMEYDESSCREATTEDVAMCLAVRDTRETAWVHVDGVHHVGTVARIGDHFGLHPLVQEDILNTNQRPKVDMMEGYLYLVLRLLDWDEASQEIRTSQLSVVLGPHYVLSFEERASETFAPLRDRIRRSVGRIRRSGADYLAYAIMDVVVDHYFGLLEHLDEQVENLEVRLVASPTPEMLGQLNRLKRQALFLRKSIWPLREVIARLQRRDSALVSDGTTPYLRDLYDHVVHVIDTVETLRDMLSGMLDVYLTGVSNRMNEVMKVLTVISTIFIPLTFLCGLYGMNFKDMPELSLEHGYALLWVVMLAITGTLVAFFRRKRWL